MKPVLGGAGVWSRYFIHYGLFQHITEDTPALISGLRRSMFDPEVMSQVLD